MKIEPELVYQVTFPDTTCVRYKLLGDKYVHINTLVFIGGAFQTIENISSSVKILTDSFNVIIVEAGGSPATADIPEEVSYSQMAGNIARLLASIGLYEFYLMGCSGGAVVSSYIKALGGFHIPKMVLVGCAPLSDDTVVQIQDCIQLIDDGKIKKAITAVLKLLLNYRERQHIRRFYAVEKGLREELESLSVSDFSKYRIGLHKVLALAEKGVPLPRCPTLILAGEYDHLTPIASIQKMVAGQPHINVVSIPRCDHLCNVEDRKALVLEILHFLL